MPVPHAAVFACDLQRSKNQSQRRGQIRLSLCGGIVSIIAVQSAINLAVVTGSIPPTGLPLPFISYGGTSLVMFMFAAGLLLNVSRNEETPSVSHL